MKCEHHNAKNQIKYAEKAFKDAKLVVETLKMTPEIVNMEMEDNGDNNMEVDILDISVRAYYCLKRAKITTLKQLSEMTINEFINKTNSIGRSVLPELCKKLKENGLSFYRKKYIFSLEKGSFFMFIFGKC